MKGATGDSNMALSMSQNEDCAIHGAGTGSCADAMGPHVEN